MQGIGRLPVIILAVVAGLVVSVSAQKVKPAPPPAPFTLTPALNIVTSEFDARLRAWGETTPNEFAVVWTQNDVVIQSFALGDVDGDGFTELIIPAVCDAGTKRNPDYRLFLKVYKQNGPVYTGNCLADSVQVPVVPSSQTMTLAYDLDGDGRDEIVVGTNRNISVFGFSASLAIEQRANSRDFAALGAQLAGAAFTRQSLAIGDVDHDGGIEIVCSGSFYTGANETGDRFNQQYLLVFSPTFALEVKLEGYKKLTGPDSPSGLESFTIEFRHGLAVADTDSDGFQEVWASGWENHADGTTPLIFKQHVRSWTVSGSEDQELVLTPGPSRDWDTTQLGPKIAAGRLLAGPQDQIVLSQVGGATDTAVIWRWNGTSFEESAYRTPATLHQATVLENRLYLAGTIPSSGRTQPSAVYLGVLKLEEDGGLTRIWSNDQPIVRDGYQLLAYAVGRGTK